MHAKVVRLVALMEAGFALRAVEPRRDGGLTLRLTQAQRVERLDFQFYEVPAVRQATNAVGVGG